MKKNEPVCSTPWLTYRHGEGVWYSDWGIGGWLGLCSYRLVSLFEVTSDQRLRAHLYEREAEESVEIKLLRARGFWGAFPLAFRLPEGPKEALNNATQEWLEHQFPDNHFSTPRTYWLQVEIE